jgi:malate synthase
MTDMIRHGELEIARALHDFVNSEALPGTGVSPDHFWAGAERIINAFAPKARALVAERAALQAAIDDWHKARRGEPHDPEQYRTFLADIGYLVPEGEDFSVTTADVDDEIALIAGPQLVVPMSNPRYALNAANARWGSLYDALYGTDAIAETDGAERGKAFNPKRAEKVVAWAKAFLDDAVPVFGGSHGEVLRAISSRTPGSSLRSTADRRPGSSSPVSSRAMSARRLRPAPFFWSTTACISRSLSTGTTRWAAATMPASPT